MAKNKKASKSSKHASKGSKAHGGKSQPAKPIQGGSWKCAAPPALGEPSPGPLAAWDKFLAEFDARDLDGQIEVFEQTLRGDEMSDPETAFELLARIFEQCRRQGTLARFDEVLARFHDLYPDFYEDSQSYYRLLQLESALIQERSEAAAKPALELARGAGRDIDQFFHAADLVAAHGRLPLLVEMMRAARPKVERSGDVVPWANDELVGQAAIYELLLCLERHPEARGDEPELIECQKAWFGEDYVPETLRRWTQTLSGRAGRGGWRLEDFKIEPRKPKADEAWEEDEEEDWDDEEAAGDEEPEDERPRAKKERPKTVAPPPDPGFENLVQLSLAFLGWLRRERGVPWSKGELAREKLVDYLTERAVGKLDPNQPRGMLAALNPPRRRKPPFHPPHPLLPDMETLDLFLGQLLHFLNPQIKRAAVLLEILPAWPEFLELEGLSEQEPRLAAQAAVDELRESLSKILGK